MDTILEIIAHTCYYVGAITAILTASLFLASLSPKTPTYSHYYNITPDDVYRVVGFLKKRWEIYKNTHPDYYYNDYVRDLDKFSDEAYLNYLTKLEEANDELYLEYLNAIENKNDELYLEYLEKNVPTDTPALDYFRAKAMTPEFQQKLVEDMGDLVSQLINYFSSTGS